MKKLIPFVAFVLFCSVLKAQDSVGLKKHYLKVYSQALNYNDAAAAINALQGYIAVDNSQAYKDTLSILYFTTKNYYSALILSEEVYKADAKNIDAMARAAECYDELGDPKTAVDLYEKVVKVNPNPYHHYKLAVSQYQMKRTAECEASAKKVLADTSAKRIGIPFTSMDGSQQAVPVNAAAANLIGVLRMDVKNYAEAKKYFQDALTMFPQFAGAKGNLDVCDKNLKTGTKPAVKPVGTKPKT